MGQWVVTVAGIAILSVLCDVILPEGQTRKYIKTVVGIIVTIVMLQPILSLVNNSVGLSAQQLSGSQSVTVQQSYLDMVESKEREAAVTSVRKTLDARGVTIKNIEVSQAAKSVAVKVDNKESDELRQQIDNVLKTYFDGYKIKIEWK